MPVFSDTFTSWSAFSFKIEVIRRLCGKRAMNWYHFHLVLAIDLQNVCDVELCVNEV